MFRKDETACHEWSKQNVMYCAARQAELLDNAAVMLKAGGRLVYSTCTFSPEENEGRIAVFLERHPEFEIDAEIDYEKYYQMGFSPGHPEWAGYGSSVRIVKKTFRLFPHKIAGEGHFIAVLHKREGELGREPGSISGWKDKKLLADWEAFQAEMGFTLNRGAYQLFGDQLYLVPEEMIDMKGMKVLRPGLHLGTLKKNRFEPSHSLALALSPEDTVRTVSFGKDSREILSYLQGETVLLDGMEQTVEKGWNLVCVDGYSIGWGKVSQNKMKNHYPKGLRW